MSPSPEAWVNIFSKPLNRDFVIGLFQACFDYFCENPNIKLQNDVWKEVNRDEYMLAIDHSGDEPIRKIVAIIPSESDPVNLFNLMERRLTDDEYPKFQPS
ncbi:MAG: hypothetical protein ABIF08_02005 [Nanoarchaeota archaeon]